ncbi:synaptic vesicle glycoprotein 2C-like isoform X2 [Photinus pyralis]|uniref:synaptic vesicle glycoprotein 2C-like isoform X2 n=1 Tax=Photinus pyralis TaxID=7054 RepID=UPI0012676F25|nr:synaptic vesicle glycoprotein 2C-like isoform X2 [Photinus pyralis]XP_031332488.1 synaptic vesicle glycoprotein 2C-like isoform X2 [Photinus pyralis]
MTANSVELSRSGGSVVTGTTEGCDSAANHEVAVKASSFGLFNVLVIAIMLPASLSSVFSTTSMSYVFPIAQCDLNLTVDDKGLLNSVTYFGMLVSGFLWGVLTDLFGRRKLLVFLFFFEGIMVILTGFSQYFAYLVAAKFVEGIVITGGVSTVLTYTNEFHSAYHRTFIPVINGIYSNLASIVLPLVGWSLFTDSMNLSLFNDGMLLRSWNIFLFVTAIPSFVAFVFYMILPESPKFLMTVGKREEALEVFRTMFRINTRRSRDEYPITTLVDESKLFEDKLHGGHVTSNRSNMQALKEGCQQIQPLFYPPFLINIFIVLTINFGLLMGLNTIRLWTPQLFIALNNYESLHKENGFDLCGALSQIGNDGQASNETCFVNYNNGQVYLHNIVVSVAAIVIIVCSLPLMGKFKKKNILCGTGICSGLCGVFIYFSTNIVMAIALISVNVGCTYIALNVLLSIVIDLFPTSLRTIAVSLAMVFGRLGSSIGNVIFPPLLTSGCFFPFLTVGGMAAGKYLQSFTQNFKIHLVIGSNTACCIDRRDIGNPM